MKLNENTDLMIKNVKLMELNTKTVTAILDTQTLEMTFVTHKPILVL